MSARALPAYPGEIPADLDQAYACQETAIRQWPDEIAGWKIGRIPAALEGALGQSRLAGPIFHRGVSSAPDGGSVVRFPVFLGGFAAVEAEFVFEIGQDAPADKLVWTRDEALSVVSGLRIGVELAGSPLSTINDLGPTVVVSDFGNNAGLILGPSIEHWRGPNPHGLLVSETSIDGVSLGRASAGLPPEGPVEALQWLLEHCARRARPLKRGQLVSSGATTGIHEIACGQMAVASFGPHGVIRCMAEAATPSPQEDAAALRRHHEPAP